MLSTVTLPGLILLVQFTPGMKTDLVLLNPLMGLAPQHAHSFGGSGKKIELGSRADRIGTGCAALADFFFTNFLRLWFFVCLLVVVVVVFWQLMHANMRLSRVHFPYDASGANPDGLRHPGAQHK